MPVDVTDKLGASDLESILNQQTELAVAPTASLMTVAYAVLSVSHLFLLPRPEAYVMASLAMSTAIAIGTIWRMRYRTELHFSAHHVIGVLSMLALLNIAAHMVLLEDRLQTTHIAICLLGMGFIMLHRVWFAASVCTYLLVWWGAYQRLPAANDSYHFEYLLGLSCLIAVSVHVARYRATVRTETDRVFAERHRKELEEKLNEASRLITLGELTASISHEVNQPLSAISNYATACKLNLSGKTVDAEFLKQQVDRIGQTAVRTGKIIQRLRGLATNSTHERACLDLNQILQDSLDMMHSDLQSHGVHVEKKLAEDLPSVSADEIQIQQVMINLLQNGVDSLQSASTAPKLVVETKADKGSVCVMVADNGPCISFSNKNAVFDAFCTTKSDGMGMGLAICRSIMENHGGRIWCRSEIIDDEPQTEFHFSLPRHSEVERV